LTLAALEHLPSVGLLAVACIVLWRREGRTTEKLVATLEGQTEQLGTKLAELKGSVDAGISGLTHRLEQHTQRLEQHQRRLDRHSRILTAISSGSRPR